MEKITKNCCGCHACFNICPINCISIKPDSEGFCYPEIDSKRCIGCGKCKLICPILKKYEGNEKGRAYACTNKDDEVRKHSSSGGIFTLIAEYVLEQNGVVFGAAFDEELNVHHIPVTQKENLYILRGSKYLQSNIGTSYSKARAYLEDGKLVLFTGTPCQISGLKSYLGKNYDNLFLQDIICHGVPSPYVWQKYLRYVEKNRDLNVKNANFRNKKHGWNLYSLLLEYSDDTYTEQIHTENLYMKGFLANLCLRPSCYNCHSKSLCRESDITLADFWGVENIIPEMFDNIGTSLVFANSPKGEKLLSAIHPKMICKEVDIDEAVKYNSPAYKSVEYPKNRDKFMSFIDRVNFDRALSIALDEKVYKKFARKIIHIVRGVLRYVQK